MSQKNVLLGLSEKRVYDKVELPEPIGTVHMRTLTAGESIEVANFRFDNDGKPVPGRERFVGAKRLSLAIVDGESKNLMFGEEDLEAIAGWPEAIIEPLQAKYWEMSRAEYAETFLKNVAPAA